MATSILMAHDTDGFCPGHGPWARSEFAGNKSPDLIGSDPLPVAGETDEKPRRTGKKGLQNCGAGRESRKSSMLAVGKKSNGKSQLICRQ
jgi:hypothetical protein